jgi:hypothetical protein
MATYSLYCALLRALVKSSALRREQGAIWDALHLPERNSALSPEECYLIPIPNNVRGDSQAVG